MNNTIFKRILCMILSIAMILSNLQSLGAFDVFSSQVFAEEENINNDGEVGNKEEAASEADSYSDVYYDNNPDTGSFSLDGMILYKDNQWADIVRPMEFIQPIILLLTYRDEAGELHSQTVTAQDDDSKKDYYLKFVHDGEGGGSFTIENIPKSIRVGETDYQVRIDVYVDTPYECYKSSTITINQDDVKSSVQANGTLELSLNTQTITLDPNVVPEGLTENPTFNYSATFTNNISGLNIKTKTITKDYTASRDTSAVISVPIGIEYKITQATKDGYKFDNSYIVSIDGEDNVYPTSASGTIENGKDIIVNTKNYSQNVELNFKVMWTDNESVHRPTLSENNFKLYYQIEGDASWIEYQESDKEKLGMVNSPVFNTTKLEETGIYCYTGLPSTVSVTTEDGEVHIKNISFKVEMGSVPAGYVEADYVDASGMQIFTLEEKSGFYADIYWKDNSDKYHTRPVNISDYVQKLRLYRRIGNGQYLPVYENAILPEEAVVVDADDGHHWIISLPNLPRYSDENEEYDYALVQGSINEAGEIVELAIDNYLTYYSNGTGSFGNDYEICHNGGKINELLSGYTNLSVSKLWKDSNENSSDRPDAKLVLWRYVDDSNEGFISLDEAYASGKAAQVVYYTSHKEYEYTLDEDGNRVIKVDENGKKIYKWILDENLIFENVIKTQTESSYTFYNLPLYDGQGREYFYFIREMSEATDYGEFYTAKDAEGNVISYQAGTVDGGIVTNVKREKAGVLIAKSWNNPSGLSDIDGVKVQLTLSAPTVNEDGSITYKDLIVYSDKEGSYNELSGKALALAQTATGFKDYISTSEVFYYVNIYDENGNAIDMRNLIVKETVTDDEGTVTSTEYTLINGEPSGTIKLKEKNYSVTTIFEEGRTDLDSDTKKYVYRQINTISENRSYTINKKWSLDSEYYENVLAVNFTLFRRSTSSDSAAEEVVGTYRVPKSAGDTWSITTDNNLPKYDSEGYEYLYWATESTIEYIKEGATVTDTLRNFNSELGVTHYRYPEYTTAVNYKTEPGGYGFFTVTKQWADNGDTNKPTIQLRVYLKSELKNALEGLDANSIVDFSVLDAKGVKYYTSSLTSANNNYSTNIGIGNLVECFGDSTKKRMSDYLVLEYSLGNNENIAEYTCSQLLAASEYDLSAAGKTLNLDGKIATDNYQYRVHEYIYPATSTVIIKNTKFGQINIAGKKVWNDNNNTGDFRPGSVTFQIYRDSEIYKPDSLDITTEGDGVVAVYDSSTGLITLSCSGNASEWKFRINNLEMYDDKAVPYSYSIDENPVTTNDATSSTSYVQKKVVTSDPEKENDKKEQNFIMTYDNTLIGVVSHVAYKYWKDPSTNVTQRPDIYLTLYRKAGEEGDWEVFEDYKNQIWESQSDVLRSTGVADPLEQGFNWRITVKNLPKFDDNGVEYYYEFRETMNNNGLTVLGRYTGKSETKQIKDEDGNVIGHYEVLTNTLSDYMKLDGKKTWTGLAGYKLSADVLPDPTILLYRTTDDTIDSIQRKTDEEIISLISAGKILLIDSTQLTENKTTYVFPSTENKSEAVYELIETTIDSGSTIKVYKSENGCFIKEVIESAGSEPEVNYYLPKYDENGDTYYYFVRETIIDPIASQLYTKENANGTLSNVFRNDVNRRNIEVTKKWTGWESVAEAEKKFHSVTYNLYRYEMVYKTDDSGNILKDSSGKPIFVYDETNKNATKVLVATGIITPSQFNSNGEASYTFKDLLIYSPVGIQYGYYVEEACVNGYTTTYTDEDGSYNSSSNVCDVTSLPEKWNDAYATKDELTSKVSTENEYTEKGTLAFSGIKEWDDYNDAEELRPKDPVRLILKRSTSKEGNYANKVDSFEVDLLYTVIKEKQEDGSYIYVVKKWVKENDKWTLIAATDCTYESLSAEDNYTKYIVWEKSGNKWNYKIYGLERYAPNGLSYTYTLEEDITTASGYGKAGNVSIGADTIASKTDATAGKMTNKFTGTYYVRKNWMDGNNKYNLRPSSITVVLFRSNDGGNTYSPVIWSEGYPDGGYIWNQEKMGWKEDSFNVNTTSLENGTKVVSVKLTSANEMTNTRKNSWQYTFKNLPTQDKNGNEYIYRCQEVQVGGVDIEKNSNNKYTDGTYERKYTQQDENKTVVENTLNSTDLIVTKTWEDDDNFYSTRPASVTFKLQKRGYKVRVSTEENGNNAAEGTEYEYTAWSDVGYTFTLTKSDTGTNDNVWTTTLSDLPVAEYVYDDEGNAYVIYNLWFRAIEIHSDDTETSIGELPLGAKNYKDITHNGDDDQTDHHLVGSHNVSNITNKLILDNPVKNIEVTKNWKRVEGESVTATLELQYRIKGSSEEWKSFPDGGIKFNSASTKTSSDTHTWNNMPMYDSLGNLLEYRVIEYELDGYKTEISSNESAGNYATEYTFTNIELQDYSVKKIWNNADYSKKDADGKFTSTFVLQYLIEGESEWKIVEDSEIKLTSSVVEDTDESNTKYTWKKLKMYTPEGKKITYRAVETQINGITVNDNGSNGDYIVTYTYDETISPEFKGKITVATNRMVYGFVNLSKEAAYLAPSITPSDISGKKVLQSVVFNIYRVNADNTESLFVEGIQTDANGNLIVNADGTYGSGSAAKYLVTGKYVIKEAQPLDAYSAWAKGIEFTVSDVYDASNSTGEHGTAWISTSYTAGASSMKLSIGYLANSEGSHGVSDSCKPVKNDSSAYNLESRGVINFTKTGPNGSPLINHFEENANSGESKAYFGVYLDSACQTQIAGMVAAAGSETDFVLTNKKADGTTIDILVNASNNLPYLRPFEGTGDDMKYQFTLLSGTYYIREDIAPAGYKLDSEIRKAVISKIETTEDDTDLSGLYTGNKAKISVNGSGTAAYKWSNDPSVVTIYKLDQYGRKVLLASDDYLILSVSEGTFLTGENTISLYQNADLPATKNNGEIINNISYDSNAGAWTITGLLDIGKIYTLSEPDSSVPANNVKAVDFVFELYSDGKIKLATGNTAVSAEDPTKADGSIFDNGYNSNTSNNVIVLRDSARYLKDVTLEKLDSSTNAAIANISFELYKKVDGEWRSVLEDGVYLTTNSEGKIVFKDLEAGIKNLITNCDLRYGVDIGQYKFVEVERGASDQYRLAKDVYFDVISNGETTATDYESYAKVVFHTSQAEGAYHTEDTHITQNGEDKVGKLTNDPVVKEPKYLDLYKVDSSDESKLAGAHFELSYKSTTSGTTGSVGTDVIYCTTDSDGQLYVAVDGANGDWSIRLDGENKVKVDISRKGSYTLKEILAPENYMTSTVGTSKNPVIVASFEVNSDNQIVNIVKFSGKNNIQKGDEYEDLVKSAEVVKNADGEDASLKIELTNDKTVVYVSKRNDIENNIKTKSQQSLNGAFLQGATLEIYKGIGTTGELKATLKDDSSWKVEGILIENIIYTLHESIAPVGYLKADDIYFYIFGTTTKEGKNVSQLYVWAGEGAPTSITTGNWSTVRNIKDNILTMVDEAIIAPVDIQKVVGSSEYEILAGAVFEVKAGDTTLGEAISNANGYLVWKSITTDGYASNSIYTSEGKIVNSGYLNNSIILQQNESGYTFTEISAPDNAYCDGKTYTVKITGENYKAYKTASGYETNKYVDIKSAEVSASKTVEALSERNTIADNTDLVNPAFVTYLNIYKYDAENANINDDHNNYSVIGMKGVTFTLYRQNGANWNKVNDYVTGDNGLLNIEISNKGTYKLVETQTLTGYEINNTELIFTVVNSDYKKTISYNASDNASNTNKTKSIKDENGDEIADATAYDLPNYRKHGQVTLIKKDGDSGKELGGVKFILERVTPAINSKVDKYFPSESVQTLEIVTGKTYSNVYAAETLNDILVTDTVGESGDEHEGILIVKDLQWGTYKVTEIEEYDGYIIINTPYEFTITADGLEKHVTDTGKEFVDNSKNSLTINKTSPEGIELSDATFKLYPVTVNGEEMTMSTTAAKFYTSLDALNQSEETTITAGNTTIYGITKGTYVLHEIKAPKGYELARDILFTMDSNGSVTACTTCTVNADNKVTKDLDGSAVVSLVKDESAHTNKVTVKDTPIIVELNKALKDNVGLASRGNSTFVITGNFADGLTTKTFSSNTNTINAQFIGGNEYEIKETAAPAGYEVQQTAARFKVNTDGTVEVLSGASFLGITDNTSTPLITFTDEPIEINLKKTDEAGIVIPAGLELAKFSIRGKLVSESGEIVNDVTVENLTVENFKNNLSKRLIYGEEYTVTETFAPNGYKLTPAFKISIDKAGNIRTVSGSDASGVGTTELAVKNHPNEVSFVKVEDGNNPLSGAKFTLKASDNRDKAFVNITADNKPANANDWTEKEISWTSNNTGFVITNHLIADVSYTLIEERVPNHEIMKEAIVFHVNLEGKVVIDTNPGINNSSDDIKAVTLDSAQTKLTILNPIIRGQVTLTKYYRENESDTPVSTALLEGAVYELYRVKDASHNELETAVKISASKQADGSYSYSSSGSNNSFVTDSNGKITITGLPEGDYEFREINAPYAYHINNAATDKVEFTIKDSTEAYSLSNTDIDTRVNASIKLTKFSNNAVLPGTKFDVAYSTTKNGNYISIGTMVTGSDGSATFSQGIYGTGLEAEGLRRGFYRLTEIKADGQMLNTVNKTPNTIAFEIGNEIKKVYEIKSGTDVEYTRGGSYISLDENGVIDTAIPKKSVSVTKYWIDDSGMIKTFQPASIKVQLYRSYNGNEAEKFGGEIELNTSNSWSYTWQNLDSYVNVSEDDKDVTYLYTYTVQEVNPKSWYTVTYGTDTETNKYSTEKGNGKEATVEDGNTIAPINNTLIGGNSSQELKIKKTLGGGSSEDEFYIRVKLKDSNGNAIGNKQADGYGYYLDSCSVTGGTETSVIPDSEGWMVIKGGETITVKLPKGIYYEVEEKTKSNGDAILKNASQYSYIPRYDAKHSGTILAATETEIINAVHKTISIKKINNVAEELTGAEYKLIYNPGTADAVNPSATESAWEKTECYIKDGVLVDKEGNAIDITHRGTYTIYETKAPANYITPTDNSGNPIILAIITVNSRDLMSVNVGNNANAISLVSLNNTTGLSKELSMADISVKNEKTSARIGKTIDYAKVTGKDSDEGTYLQGAVLQIKDGDNILAEWNTTDNNPYYTVSGLLEEGKEYTLHEVSTPNGYKLAADVKFKLEGTYTVDGNRYSRIVITSNTEQNSSGTLYGDAGVVAGILNMADETIISPVDLQKVLANSDNTEFSAVGESQVEFTVKAGSIELGIAKTNAKGYLVWKSINTDAYALKLIYDGDGHIATSTTNSVIGETIILRQNEEGYTFTESYSSDHIYNDGRSYSVYITQNNYEAYRTADKTGTLYNNLKYINLVKTSADAGGKYVVEDMTDRTTTISYSSSEGLAVNLPYKSTIEVHKYDADAEADKRSIEGTEFTLYRDSVADSNIYKKAYEDGSLNATGIFTTDENGNIKIQIPEKGKYILVETKATTGYKPDSNNSFEFTLQDKSDTTEKADGKYGYNETNELKKDDEGIPNSRYTGEVTLSKKDADSNVTLEGVEFTLERTDSPKDKTDVSLLNYMLNTSRVVKTGYTYKFTQDLATGEWNYTETKNTAEGTEGSIYISGLNWGTYKLTEKTELSGYKYDTEVNQFSFSITAENSMPNAEKPSSEQTNKKNSVSLVKTNNTSDTDDSIFKKLEGAVFEVHKFVEGTLGDKVEFYAAAADTATVSRVTTGSDGSVTIYGLPTDTAAGTVTYALVEIQAPKGYKLQKNPVIFTIERDGTVKVEATSVSEVVMKNDPIKIYVNKLGETGTDKLAGAEFVLTDVCEDCDHKFAVGNATEIKLELGDDGQILIPIQSLIGGHSYKLVETKAPKGYECTAVVTFKVDENGEIQNLNSSGGYVSGTDPCAYATSDSISVRDEKIRAGLDKVNAADHNTKLAGVSFKLTPCEGSTFATNVSEKIYTTDNFGHIDIDEGLLIHDNSYLLQETSTIQGYYLSNESRDGVIINVSKEGYLSITRLEEYSGKTLEKESDGESIQVSSCPVTVGDNKYILISENTKSTSFDLTKYVDGNMGDLSGEYQIELTVTEPDGTPIKLGGTDNSKKTIKLKLKDVYDSVNGNKIQDGTYDSTNAYGVDAIPVGAKLVIKEDNELDYAAVIKVKNPNGELSGEMSGNEKGIVSLKLSVPTETTNRISIELINRKNVTLDIGVPLEGQAPWAILSLIMPAIWLAYRYKKKRREVME